MSPYLVRALNFNQPYREYKQTHVSLCKVQGFVAYTGIVLPVLTWVLAHRLTNI